MRPAGRWLVVVLASILFACGGGSEAGVHNPGELFPDRANQYREDQERRVGEAAFLGGYTTTVTQARLDESGTRVRVDVAITNRDDEVQRVDGTQWTLVNPRIQTLEAVESTFASTELEGGATMSGTVSFAVDPDEVGPYYIQYKPEVLDAARGVWQLVVR